MRKKLLEIWRNRRKIFEGLKKSIFKEDYTEYIADYRIGICKRCRLYDTTGDGCVLKGTQPCCNELLGGCGCSLHIKTRSLSSSCPKSYWLAVMTQEEEDKL